MKKAKYSYSLNDDNVLTVWENNCILATVQDVSEKSAERLFKEVVYDLREIEL